MQQRTSPMHHARKRAAERYGLQLSAADMRVLCATAEAQRLRRGETERRSVHFAWVRGRILKFAYNVETRTVTTVLPDGGQDEIE